MNKTLGVVAFLLGLAAVVWIGFGYVGSHALALTMTVLIGAFYLMGGLELHRFQQATASLNAALAAIPDPLTRLADWLATLHPSLQNPVRLRIEGERAGLPGPAMTPYLVGLLVLLGMLGTFLGMVVTLNGTAMALDSSTDLPTIRAALSAPVKGLGLAFGTSVAGVAASAMLGLVSAVCRRERLQASQRLDTVIATRLRGFSRAHQREATLDALQSQARVVPEVVAQLHTTMQAMMAQAEQRGQALNERLLASQEAFFQHATQVHAQLASSVGQALQASLAETARLTGATIQPLAEATLAGLARETGLLHERLAGSVEQASARLLGAVEGSHAAGQAVLAQSWREALAHQAEADQQRQAALVQTLAAMATSLQQAWRQAGAETLGHQAQICSTLERTASDMHAQAEAHARSTIAEITRLTHTAAEAPRAAAELIGQLRQQLSDSLVHDTGLLEERQRIMETLRTLLDAIQHAATEQRGAIDALVQSSTTLLQQVGAQLTDRIESESTRLAAAAVQVSGSAVEVSSLGEAFGFAVQQFSESSQALVGTLSRIEGALDKSSTRSDEQLAYYVAQAREVIELSMLSQKQIVEDLQQLASRQSALAGEAA